MFPANPLLCNPTNSHTNTSQSSSSTDQDSQDYLSEGFMVTQPYYIQGVLGEGRFGVVYGTVDLRNGRESVLKVYKTRVVAGPDGLLQTVMDSDQELALLTHIATFNYDKQPVPHIYDYGRLPGKCAGLGAQFMVQERLGLTLETVLTACGGRLELDKVLHIAQGLVQAVAFLHSHSWVHCDLKPNNIIFGGVLNPDAVYLIDFGRSKRILDDQGQFLPPVGYQRYGGPLWYSSLRGHAKLDSSFCDDLQAVLYLLVHLLKGDLPWLYCLEPDTVYRLKYYTPDDAIFAQCPPGWLQAHQYIQTLDYAQWPDYNLFQQYICQHNTTSTYKQ